MKRQWCIVLLTMHALIAMCDEVPPAAQTVLDEYARVRAASLKKLNEEFVRKLQTVKTALERSRDEKGAAVVQMKIDDLLEETGSAPPAETFAAFGERSASRSRFLYITVYTEENYKGDRVRIKVPIEIAGPQDRKDHGIRNDTINSIRVPEGVEVTLFDGDLSGRSLTIRSDTPALGAMRNTISSLRATVLDAGSTAQPSTK